MFLRNFWYVAAYDNEIGRKPLGRTVLGELRRPGHVW